MKTPICRFGGSGALVAYAWGMLKRTMTICLLATLVNGCASDYAEPVEDPGKSDTAEDASFFEGLPGWGRYIALDKLDKVIPVYLAETQKVLELIDELPQGVVDETTKLDEVPIVSLFANGDIALGAVVDESAFRDGRNDHDIAWLRQSAVGLEKLANAVDQAIATGSNPANSHFTNVGNWTGSAGNFEINIGVRAVSRFYCNLDIRISDDNGFSVETGEFCD
jgi:hypothetical protein